MPNWCYNHLQVSGKKEILADFISKTIVHAKEDDELFEKCKSLLKEPESDIGQDILFDYLFNRQFPYDETAYDSYIVKELNQVLK